MPGLQLKAEHVQRLCGIEPTVCDAVLQSLVDDNFLRVKSDGHYARLIDGAMPRPTHAIATLRDKRPLVKAS
jgi:hypothetical protein